MKFWQKVFLSTLVLFLFLLNGSIFLLSSVTYQNNLKAEKDRIASEEHSLSATLQNYFTMMKNSDSLNTESILRVMESYSNYYKDDGVYLRLYHDDEEIFAKDGLDFKLPDSKETVVVVTDAGETTLVCALGEIPGFEEYRLAYFRSIAELEEMWDGLQRLFLIVSLSVSVVLAAALLVFVSGLTRPLTRLAQAAGEVASGKYDVCLTVKGKDEVARLTADFNHMTEEIRGHMQKLQDEADRKQRFLDNFTHELRTPLTNIYGYSELLMRTSVSEEDRLRYLQYMMRESKRLNLMSTELFNLTVLQKNDIEMTDVQCGELLSSAEDTLREKAAKKQVRLTVIPSELTVWGNWTLLESLVINLVENAIRACNKGGEICLSFGQKPGATVLCVRDNGRGMAPEELEHITEPFYRVDKARSRADGGVGLGLYLCSEIVRLHHAGIHFESAPGMGTTATVSFPFFTAP